MHWYKASNSLIDDPKLRLISYQSNVPHYVTVTLLHSLLERCSKNNSSIFTTSKSFIDEVSYQTSLDKKNVERCLSGLESNGIISDNILNNWDKYQSPSSTERVRNWRDKKKNETNVTVTSVTETNVTQNRIEENRIEENRLEKKEIEKTNKKENNQELFIKFYDAYAYKVGRPLAEKSFYKALTISTLEEILAGVERYKKTRGIDPKYWKHPSTWLNAEGWNDQLPIAKKITTGTREIITVQRQLEN